MSKIISYLLIAVGLAACIETGDPPDGDKHMAPATPPEQTVPPQSDRTFVTGKRVGLITTGMPMSRVENMYGSDNLISKQIDAGEGTTMPGYVLFPGTEDELLIELGEDKQPDRARFTNQRTGWKHLETGLTIGTTLGELQEMNGKPFEFLGFGWDYGGTVTEWQNGQLDSLLVRLTYTPERLPAGGLPDSLYGEIPIQSDAQGIQGLGLRVREISVPIRPY